METFVIGNTEYIKLDIDKYFRLSMIECIELTEEEYLMAYNNRNAEDTTSPETLFRTEEDRQSFLLELKDIVLSGYSAVVG